MYFLTFIVPLESYREKEAILRLDEVNFLKMEVLKRFELVGGRIRLLLHNQISFSQLKKQVLKSVCAVSVQDLKQLDSLDLHHQAPSIIYSFVPTDILTDPREYRLQFASSYIAKRVASRMIVDFKGKVDHLFAALKDQSVGGSLVGQIFEYLVLEAIQTRKVVSISGRILGPNTPATATESDLVIDFGDFEIKKYNVMRRGVTDLRRLISDGAQTNKLLLPIQLNAPSVDAVFYDAHTQKFYFFQITISHDHPFDYLHVSKLATAFGVVDRTKIDFVYLVPRTIYNQFRPQKVESAPARGFSGFRQCVFRIDNMNNACMSILDHIGPD